MKGQTLTSGIFTVAGSIKYRQLHGRLVTPWRDARTKEGYQRKPADSRIAKLMMEIRNGRVDVPTAILLNAPHPSWEISVEFGGENNCSFFNLDAYLGKFSVVDGQHRLLSFTHLYDEEPAKYGDYQLQFVMMLGASMDQELEQFYVVNSTAKSVKTDLAFDLLKQRAERDGAVLTGLIEVGQDWKVEAQALTEILNEKSEIWRGRIRLANEDKKISIIQSSSFVTSLKKFLTYPLVKNLSRQKKYEMIESYWRGVRGAMKEPFATLENYTLLKGIGVWAMHEILPEVTDVIRSRGDSLFDDETYSQILRPMFEGLDGENQSAEVVKGAEFWLTAPRGGAAGSYSSSAGKRVLISKMMQGLPEPEIE